MDEIRAELSKYPVSTRLSLSGKIIVARVDNEVTVKRLKLAGSQVALMPENSCYEPIMVAPEALVVEGLFVGVIRERNRLH